MTTVNYLRKGRKLRATGEVLFRATSMTKIKPLHPSWGIIWVSDEEIAAGAGKGEFVHRVPADVARKPRQARKPKAPAVPRWQELVSRVRAYEDDHLPDGWPAVTMRTLSELADEIEAARRALAELLPLSQP